MEAAAKNPLICGVCLERYRSPKLLPCFHTFCERCVQKVAGARPSFPCPTCRTVTVMPPGGAKELQANFYLEKDLAKLESEFGRECELCSQGKQAEYKCVQCQQVYCSPCRHTHDAIQSCAVHTVLPLSKDGADKTATGTDKKCSKHRNQPLLLFCRQCKLSICMQCKLTSHDGHETEDVVDTGERAKAELIKEQQSLAQREQLLQAFLSKVKDFQDDLDKEKQAAETAVRSRTREMEKMVAQAEKEALDSVSETTEATAEELKKQAIPVKEKLETIVAKRQYISQVIEKGDDGEAVAMSAQLTAEAELAKISKSSKTYEELLVLERGTVVHEFKSRAIKYGDVLAYVGLARAGPVLETKALSVDAESLQESVKPHPPLSGTSYLSFQRHRMSKEGASSFLEVAYSKNPKAKLSAMHLTSDDAVWMHFNPGGNVPFFALFDDDGNQLEVRYENVPASAFLVNCENDTTVCLQDGRWVRPGGESGTLDNFTVRPAGCTSKSAERFLLQSTSIFQITSTALPPQISANQVLTTTISSTLGFDVSSDGQFFAFANGATAYVFDKLATTTALRQFATYNVPDGQAVNDVCFSFVDGEEMLLVAISALNAVHLVDHKDGCCFVRALETDQCKLTTPCRLATNHQGRVWVGCNGGKLVLFDV
ncbi:RING finger protein 207-like [Littorina saxatilis]|uniref:Uncharacterized protein n=1 Tax=Littorina saxatilis TaxID=31220 RepID=A0AAN9B0W6_9CAEN